MRNADLSPCAALQFNKRSSTLSSSAKHMGQALTRMVINEGYPWSYPTTQSQQAKSQRLSMVIFHNLFKGLTGELLSQPQTRMTLCLELWRPHNWVQHKKNIWVITVAPWEKSYWECPFFRSHPNPIVLSIHSDKSLTENIQKREKMVLFCLQ